jgi:hypothetical protein
MWMTRGAAAALRGLRSALVHRQDRAYPQRYPAQHRNNFLRLIKE